MTLRKFIKSAAVAAAVSPMLPKLARAQNSMPKRADPLASLRQAVQICDV